jgi:hypothetical protein
MIAPALILGSLATAIAAGPASAAQRASSLEPLGTTLNFPAPGGARVDVTLLRVVTNAPAKTHYIGVTGHNPVVGLEYRLKNVGAKPASLTLFSTVLYYRGETAALTGSDGATKLGPSLNLYGTMASGTTRTGWVTTQGYKKKLEKIQTTLNGTTLGTWKP